MIVHRPKTEAKCVSILQVVSHAAIEEARLGSLSQGKKNDTAEFPASVISDSQPPKSNQRTLLYHSIAAAMKSFQTPIWIEKAIP